MTITYTGKVANAKFGSFIRLLFYWKGSIYKLMYKEMLLFCALYAFLSLLYRLVLTEPYQLVFERISLYCQKFTDLIPMSFILGFYVSIVVTRWWNQYMKIPWPDRVMMYLTTCLDGEDTYARIVRRTIVRYLTLGSIIVFQSTAVSVKKRFPTIDHVIEAGIITPQEAKQLEEINSPHGIWWIPFLWISNILKDARKLGRIPDQYTFKILMDEVMTFRGNLGELYSYDWISVPLVYTQVTTLAVYIFFTGALFGRQFLNPEKNYPGHNGDLYVPLFTLLQFFFYMGWLKVAEQLINPFGEDDDDFEMNWIIDRNLQVSLLAVDDLHGTYPQLEKDIFYDDPPPDYLPYTKSSINTKRPAHMGSTVNLGVSSDGMRTVNPMETINESTFRKSNQFLHSENIPHTPSSPFKHKHNFQNLTSCGNSQININNIGQRHYLHVQDDIPSKASSYMEHWMHRNDKTKTTFKPGSFNSNEHLRKHIVGEFASKNTLQSESRADDDSVIFHMEVDTSMCQEARVKRTVSLGRKLQKLHLETPKKQNEFFRCNSKDDSLQRDSELVNNNVEDLGNDQSTFPVQLHSVSDVPEEDERSRHESSEGSIDSEKKTLHNVTTTSSLAPLLGDMEDNKEDSLQESIA